MDGFYIHHTSVIRMSIAYLTTKDTGKFAFSPYNLETLMSSVRALYHKGYIKDNDYFDWLISPDISTVPCILEEPEDISERKRKQELESIKQYLIN